MRCGFGCVLLCFFAVSVTISEVPGWFLTGLVILWTQGKNQAQEDQTQDKGGPMSCTPSGTIPVPCVRVGAAACCPLLQDEAAAGVDRGKLISAWPLNCRRYIAMAQ